MGYNYEDIIANVTTVDAVSSGAIISNQEMDKLVKAVAAKLNIGEEPAFAAIAIICQKGDTSKKAVGSVYAIVNGKKLDLKTIRECMNGENLKYTLWQWARTNADLIYRISEHYDIEGDLAKKIACDRLEITHEEKIWLSNFQMDNPNCPENVRSLLMEHYRKLFPNKI